MRAAIRVKPGAARTKVGGRYPLPDDAQTPGAALIVAVNAPAVDGRANDAVIKELAKALSVSRGDIEIITGATARTKVVQFPDEAAERWRELLEKD